MGNPSKNKQPPSNPTATASPSTANGPPSGLAKSPPTTIENPDNSGVKLPGPAAFPCFDRSGGTQGCAGGRHNAHRLAGMAVIPFLLMRFTRGRGSWYDATGPLDVIRAVGFFRVESCPAQAVLPPAGLAADKEARDYYCTFGEV